VITHDSEHPDFDRGFSRDLAMIEQRIHERRQILGWIVSGATAAVIAACGGGGASGSTSSSTSSSSSSSTSAGCVADPEETNGPYPADGTNTVNGSTVNVLSASGIVRTDIRSSFGSSSRWKQGVQTRFSNLPAALCCLQSIR